MRIQTFRAATIQEALQLVRENLGPEASVLRTKEIRRSLFSRRMIEVEASRDLTVAYQFSENQNTQFAISAPESMQPNASDHSASGRTDSNHVSNSTNPFRTANYDTLKNSGNWRLNDSRSKHEPDQLLSHSTAVRQVLSELIRAGAEPSLAHQILETACQHCDEEFLDDLWLIRGQAIEVVAERLKTSVSKVTHAVDPMVLAFIGPSGVGKTSFLSNMALRLNEESHVSIGMIALDTWKVGSIDRFMHSAESVSAQVEIVGSTDELTAALHRLHECDVVMIDTVGSSPQDHQKLRYLKDILDIARPSETHLLLPANASLAYSEAALQKFRDIGTTHLSLTKTDEAIGIAQWLHLLLETDLPLAYLVQDHKILGELGSANRRLLSATLLGLSQKDQAASRDNMTVVEQN